MWLELCISISHARVHRAAHIAQHLILLDDELRQVASILVFEDGLVESYTRADGETRGHDTVGEALEHVTKVVCNGRSA